MAGPEVGDAAPDAILADLDGREVRLSSLWSERPVVLVFLRYFGCPFCQTQVVTLRNEHGRILDSGADVGLVGHGHPHEAVRFATAKRLPFPLLLDRDRGAYRSYGLVTGTVMQVLGPKVMLPWIKAELSSETRQLGLKGGSFLQMPGTFVIDSAGVVRAKGGTIRMAHRGTHVADIPSVDRLLGSLADVGGAV
jgi:peroxiredoxin